MGTPTASVSDTITFTHKAKVWYVYGEQPPVSQPRSRSYYDVFSPHPPAPGEKRGMTTMNPAEGNRGTLLLERPGFPGP